MYLLSLILLPFHAYLLPDARKVLWSDARRRDLTPIWAACLYCFKSELSESLWNNKSSIMVCETVELPVSAVYYSGFISEQNLWLFCGTFLYSSNFMLIRHRCYLKPQGRNLYTDTCDGPPKAVPCRVIDWDSARKIMPAKILAFLPDKWQQISSNSDGCSR